MKPDIAILPSYFDHTNLKQDATKDDIQKLCQEAIVHNFFAVCVNPCYVATAKTYLSQSQVKTASVIGFPLGANRADLKLQEALLAVKDGADELDMVANIGLLKTHQYEKAEKEIYEIRNNIPYNIILKVIVESSQLTDIEISEATKVVINSGADFIKTSTGFFGGATVEAVKLMQKTADGQIKIKASAGIKLLSHCQNMISAGASRIGCSASVIIMHESLKKN